ncbi:MAG: hypothetical protein LBP72_03880 [Dysgonamonadaceae bacterium]|nr:hypothetical protein [Dysgonamonadaceae bacterium]
MKTILKIVVTCIVMFFGHIQLNAQVTIGVDEPPVAAALLDLKDRVAGADTVSANSGGLVLPRVKLTDKMTLEPFIATTDAAWDAANQAKTKSDHIGLTVYNVIDNTVFDKGIYVWSGNEWKSLQLGSNYIYLPSFNLPWNATSVNLFDIYRQNLNFATNTKYKSSTGAVKISFPEFEFDDVATDFYYVVTYYDPNVLTISGINADGLMTYAKNSALKLPPEGSFINIVMIRKYQ